MNVKAIWNSVRMEGIATTISIMVVKYLVARQRSRDEAFDATYKTETTGYVHPAVDDFIGVNREQAIGYYPASTEAIKGMLRHLLKLRLKLRDYSLIDLGCGKGKALVIASQYPFHSIIGLEASVHTSDIARQNLSRFAGKRKCKSVTVVTDDIFNYDFQDKNLVVYVGNPFIAGSLLYETLTKKLEVAASTFRRDIYLLSYSPANTAQIFKNDSLLNLMQYTSVSDDHCWAIYKVTPKRHDPSTCLRIVLLTDLEEGHIIPTFALAKNLTERGHDVIYLAMEDNVKLIESMGFKAKTVFAESYPAGTRTLAHEQRDLGTLRQYNKHLREILHGAMDSVLASVRPDIIITCYFLPLESLLLHYRYGINQMIYNPSLRPENESPRAECMEGIMSLPGDLGGEIFEYLTEKVSTEIQSLYDITQPLDEFPELILCPAAFEVPGKTLENSKVQYIGPSFTKKQSSETIQTAKGDGGHVIYVSFGSQVSLYAEQYRLLIRAVVELASNSEYANSHFYISLGNSIGIETIGQIPVNVTTAQWLPQTAVLEKASLAIIHGGLGTIKECIYARVPMLVYPMTRDQPANAQRVQFHGIGLAQSAKQMNAIDLHQGISSILGNPTILDRLEEMRVKFAQHDSVATGAAAIENYYTKLSAIQS